MSPEKNVVEAARALLSRSEPHPHMPKWRVVHAQDAVALGDALSAYDSAPAPSEDRVREAAEAAIIAWSGGESDPKRWPKATRDIMDAIRRYVTPAPALPAGTVAVSVETLKTWRARAIEHQRVLREGHGLRCELPTVAEIDALLPPPPRPEPPKE